MIKVGSVGWNFPHMTGVPQVKTCSGRFGNMGDHINANPSDNNSPLLRGVIEEDDMTVALVLVRVPVAIPVSQFVDDVRALLIL